MASRCGEIRSTGPVISPGARSGPIALVTMPCSTSSRVRVSPHLDATIDDLEALAAAL